MPVNISLPSDQNPINPLVTKDKATQIAEDEVATLAGTFVAVYDNTVIYGADAVVSFKGITYVTLAGVAAGGGTPDINEADWDEVLNSEYLELYDVQESYASGKVVLFIDSSDLIAYFKSNTAIAIGESPETDPGKWPRHDPIGMFTTDTAQTVTGIKTFEDTTFVMESPDETNAATLINPDSAAATTNITLPDISGTLVTQAELNTAIGLSIALSGD